MSLPPLAFLAQALQRRGAGAATPTAQPAIASKEDLLAALQGDLQPGRVPTMRSEDPDFLEQQLGPINQEQEALKAQLEQAQALMQGSGRQYTTPLGAGLGGLADALRAGVGAYRQGRAQEQMGELAKRRGAVVEAFGMNPSASAVQRDEARRGRLLQRALQGSQQEFQAGQQEQRLEAEAEQQRLSRALQERMEGARAGRAQKQAEDAAAEERRKGEDALRRELGGLPEVKSFAEIDANYQAFKGAVKDTSGAGATTAIFTFMKLIDPGVAVMEGDVERIRKSAGPAAAYANIYDQVLKGNTLPPQVRKDLEAQADAIYKIRSDALTQRLGEYAEFARTRGLSPEAVRLRRVPATQALPVDAAGQPTIDTAPATPAVQPGATIDKDGKKYRLRPDGQWVEVTGG